MSTPLEIKIKIIVRDLLGLPESQILSGRNDKFQDDYNIDYVVVDDLVSSQRLTSGYKYDGDNEIETISSNFITTFTVDFYGDNAYNNCNRFCLLTRGQQAYELKKSLGITLYQVSTIQDLQKLTGQQYGNRYQATFRVHDSRAVDISTLRIDEGQFTFLIDN